MANYSAARDLIAGIIEAVEITDPVTTTVKKVYPYRPDGGAQSVYPCVHITGYQMRVLRGPSSKRERFYTIGLRLSVRPVKQYSAEMQDICDALKEAISAAFDSKIMLGSPAGGYHVMEGPNWIDKEPQTDGGGICWDEGEILISIKDTAALSA